MGYSDEEIHTAAAGAKSALLLEATPELREKSHGGRCQQYKQRMVDSGSGGIIVCGLFLFYFQF